MPRHPIAFRFEAQQAVQGDPSGSVGMTGVEQRDPSVPWGFLLASAEARIQE